MGEPSDHLVLAVRSLGQLIVADQFKKQLRNRIVDLLFLSGAQHAEGRAAVVLSGRLDDRELRPKLSHLMRLGRRRLGRAPRHRDGHGQLVAH